MSHISRDHCACQHNKLNNTKSQVTQYMSGRISLQAATDAGCPRMACSRDARYRNCHKKHSTCAENRTPAHAHVSSIGGSLRGSTASMQQQADGTAPAAAQHCIAQPNLEKPHEKAREKHIKSNLTHPKAPEHSGEERATRTAEERSHASIKRIGELLYVAQDILEAWAELRVLGAR